MNKNEEKDVIMVPVKAVRVTNPRVRDRRKFERIVHNISTVGLKRPITVTLGKPDGDGNPT